MTDFLKFIIYGKKQGTEDSAPVGIHPSGALRVFLEGFRSTVTFAISSLPNLAVTSMPNLTVSSLPSVTANPTTHTLLAQSLLGATDTTVYTAAANWRDVVVGVTNVDTAERTCQLSLGALDDTHSIVKYYPLSVGDHSKISLPNLASGTAIHGLCDSANKVVVQVWGVAV
jgi:hypothetical protein